jgi:hypothetical protein
VRACCVHGRSDGRSIVPFRAYSDIVFCALSLLSEPEHLSYSILHPSTCVLFLLASPTPPSVSHATPFSFTAHSRSSRQLVSHKCAPQWIINWCLASSPRRLSCRRPSPSAQCSSTCVVGPSCLSLPRHLTHSHATFTKHVRALAAYSYHSIEY